MNYLTLTALYKKALSAAQKSIVAAASILLLAYGQAQADEMESYWPPQQETFTENSISVKHVGSAMRYRGNKPMYIASLYSQDNFPNTHVLYTNDGAKELQMIVMDESMSHRRFKRILKDDLIVTLKEDEYAKLQPKIDSLLKSIKSKFRVGSLVTFAYDPLRNATVVRVDQKRMTTIDGKDLFNATLKAMVGKRPPSREFKDSLLGYQAPVIDISEEHELLLTQYIDNQIKKRGPAADTKEQWVVNSDHTPEF